jgi:uncharacterized spore protein YtfJ
MTREVLLKPDKLLTGLRDAMTVSRVYGEPYERDGVTVIPAAVIRGGGGAGSGRQGADGDEGGGEGAGGGFGLFARPVGAYVIKDGVVRWEPAVDVSHIVVVGVLGGIVLTRLLTRTLGRRRGGARRPR